MSTGRRLYVTDLDGTLLDEHSRVSDESARIISELSRRGVMITVATARTPATVEPLLSSTLTAAPAVVLTGAAIWDRTTQSYSSMTLLPAAKARSVVRTALACGLHPMVYRRAVDNSHLEFFYQRGMLTLAEMRFVTDRSDLKLKRPVETGDISDTVNGDGLILVLAMGSHDDVLRAVKILRDDPGLSVSYYSDTGYPGVGFLEVFGHNVSKAEGVKALKMLTGADHLTVFGDNFNDLPMMAVADRAVAVDNAVPEVKAAVDIVIGPNTDNSVARFIAAEEGVEIDSLL